MTALRKAQYIEDLKREKGLVGARTAVAWMGIASNMWFHEVSNTAADILNSVDTLRLEEQMLGDLPPWANEFINQISQQAKEILHLPITPPLSSEDGVGDIDINELISERLAQLSENERFNTIRLETRLTADEKILVRTSYAWIRFAIDQLVDNGAKAVRKLDPSRRVISVETYAEGDKVRIVVNDKGEGMSDEIDSQIFLKQVKGKGKTGGLGMGLLIVEAIIEAYEGKISKSTGSEGTSVEITLPRQLG